MKKLILLFFVFSSFLFSNDNLSNKKIKIVGEKKDSISKRISIKEIEKIGLKEFNIVDPYTKIKTSYSGVLLNEFVNHYAKENVKNIVFTAIDGYVVTINKSDWNSFTILLVTKTNGKYAGYENKGPLRIVFPKYKIASENYTNNLPKWIWMIKTIEFK